MFAPRDVLTDSLHVHHLAASHLISSDVTGTGVPVPTDPNGTQKAQSRHPNVTGTTVPIRPIGTTETS